MSVAACNPCIDDGAYVFDSEGHRMLDSLGGMWSAKIGYAREEMVQGVADQVPRTCYHAPFGSISTPPAIEFGARLDRGLLDFVTKLRITCGRRPVSQVCCAGTSDVHRTFLVRQSLTQTRLAIASFRA